MGLRGKKACGIFDKFGEKIDARSSDLRGPKVSIATKTRGAQATVSAFGDTSGERSARNESRMCDIYGIGHLVDGRDQGREGLERSRKRGIPGYETRERRPNWTLPH